MDTMQLMELFKHYSGRLQVHEANAGAASSAVAGSTSWSCNRNPDELAYYGQHKAQQATERALEDLEQPLAALRGTDLLPSGSPPVRVLEMVDMMDIIPHGCNSIVLTACRVWGALGRSAGTCPSCPAPGSPPPYRIPVGPSNARRGGPHGRLPRGRGLVSG